MKDIIDVVYKALTRDPESSILGRRLASDMASDITSKLKNNLFTIEMKSNMSYRQAKSLFKKEYIKAILKRNRGNISQISYILGIDRRSIHRILDIEDISEIRSEIIKPEYARITEVKDIIENVLEKYKTDLTIDQYKRIYERAGEISKIIVISLPEDDLDMKKALRHFDRTFFTQMMNKGMSLKELSKSLDMRYETLIRKLNSLGIEH